MNVVTDSFYGKELGLFFLSPFPQSDRLAPYYLNPILAGTLLCNNPTIGSYNNYHHSPNGKY